MNDFKNFLVYVLLALAVVAGGVWIGTLPHGQKTNRFGDTLTGFGAKTATNSSVGMAGGATTTITSANSARSYVDVCNDNGATTKFYLALGNTAATSTGILLAGGSCYEIRDVNMYIGNITAINASSSAATATLVTIP